MTEQGESFVAALRKHDPASLREAFDACRTAGVGNYNRTTLNRWLEGSIPTQGDFVACMAQHLDDPDLHNIWEQTRHTQPRNTPNPDTVARHFAALSPDDRQAAFPTIRKLFLERSTELRRRASYRLDLRDHPNPDLAPHYHELRLTWEWDGPIAANAHVTYTTENETLGDAYETDTCIFREILFIEPDEFTNLLDTWPEQVLTITPRDQPNQKMQRHIATPTGDGTFQFDNTDHDDAWVRLSVTYPYPRNAGVYLIRFGDFRYEGAAKVTLSLSATGTHTPRAFPYLPAGRQREYAVDLGRPDELLVTLGAPDTILSDGDGVVLTWSES